MASTGSYLLLLAAAICSCYAESAHSVSAAPHTFKEVMEVLEAKQTNLSRHELFKYLADESIPVTKRAQFVPYWTYFALAAADVLDSWFRIPNPQTELERRVNRFIDEDNFHYNLFLHDVENVLGYTPSRFGSYGAILRHLWGDDSRAVRMLIFAWASASKRSDDTMVVLASFEAVEAGLKDLFETTFAKIFNGENGLPDLQYFGQAHVDFEQHHTVTAWFQEEDKGSSVPLTSFEITEDTKRISLEVVEDMFYWFHKVYDSLYNLCLADDTIYPEKYIVEGTPPMHDFPTNHPNKNLFTDTFSEPIRDEL